MGFKTLFVLVKSQIFRVNIRLLLFALKTWIILLKLGLSLKVKSLFSTLQISPIFTVIRPNFYVNKMIFTVNGLSFKVACKRPHLFWTLISFEPSFLKKGVDECKLCCFLFSRKVSFHVCIGGSKRNIEFMRLFNHHFLWKKGVDSGKFWGSHFPWGD